MPSGEWSARFSGDPPEALQRFVDQTAVLTRSLQPHLGPADMDIPDRPRVVTVLGDRGTGKSTVLRFVMHRLARTDGCMVLPVIDPESFASGDTLAGWAFAQLEQMLSPAERNVLLDEKPLELRLQELARAHAVNSSGFLLGLEQRGLTFEDFGRDAVKVPRRGIALGNEWSAIVDGLANARGEPAMQLVIVVDDADLTPELLPSIVRDAQLLGASARTCLVFAAHQDTLRQALKIGLINSYGPGALAALQHGFASTREMGEVADRRFVKLFPRSLRVSLDPLSPEERINFTPLGGEHALRDLLEQLPLHTTGYETLADLFTIRTVSGRSLGISGHVRALSDNPRDLRQLHEALSVLDPSEPHATAQALTLILKHGLETVQGSLPRPRPDLLRFELRDEAPAVAFNLRDLRFGTKVSTGHVIYRPPEPGSLEEPAELPFFAPLLVARSFVEFYAYETLGDERATHSATNSLSEQATQLIHLAWESVQQDAQETSLLVDAGHTERLVLPGDTVWGRLVYDPQAQVRWRYWTVPDWEAFSDYFLVAAGWDALVALIPGITSRTSALSEYLLLSHLRLVAATQRERRVPDEIMDLTREQIAEQIRPEAWPANRKKLLDLVVREMAAVLEAADQDSSMRDRDFVLWFYGLFPFFASRLFTTPELSEDLLSFWRSQVSEAQRQIAVELIAEQAVEHLRSDVAEADIDLLRRLDEERASLLEPLHKQLEASTESARVQTIQYLTANEVPQHVIDTLQSSGATRQALFGLTAAGVEPAVLARIAELFPFRPSVSDEAIDTAEPAE